MNLNSWGRYPCVENTSFQLNSEQALERLLDSSEELIAFGNGRSYGDSALNRQIIHCRSYHYFLGFDEASGVLRVQAGVLLSEILDAFVHRGWFLKITPGTRLITIGGAIASDVHGKNHHQVGCFSECVESFRLMLADGSVVDCSKQENQPLFRATCGGMGLTGVILEASIKLTRIKSAFLDQQTIKTANLKETFDAFEAQQHAPYSVAWLDCLASGNNLGRGLLMTGRFRDDGDLNYRKRKALNVGFDFPGFALNQWSIKAFNALYYGKARRRTHQSRVDIDGFFYPLDAINNWNRIYGKKGFIQYQIVLPKAASYQGLSEMLTIISSRGKGSFLAVLKLCGASNENYLSFPMEGYSLALDFKIDSGVFALLDLLDEIVVQLGGRVYLAKDARVSQAVYEKGFAQIEAFRQLRQQYSLDQKFNSLQSRRVGL